MKKTKMEKGITLIALIITVVVLLILAVVTIKAIQDNGIIAHAQNATKKYEEEAKKEEALLNSYLPTIEENIPGGENSSIASTTEDGVPIPVGFKYVEGTKNDGLVIEHETEGSQFVWVPVTTNIVAYGLGINGYREPDVVTERAPSETVDSASGEKYDALVANLQRAGCTEDLNDDNIVNAYDFKIQLTNEFNAMATSVKKYGGFYVGRYETSINSGKAQSKKWTEENQITSVINSSSATDWYGQYALCKTYGTSSVQGSMIWGSQYDAMMTWMGDLATNFDTSKRNTDRQRRTGYVETDVIKKVYDLGGNYFEWTLEAYSSSHRIYRGGDNVRGFSLSSRGGNGSTNTYGDRTTRLTLYIV